MWFGILTETSLSLSSSLQCVVIRSLSGTLMSPHDAKEIEWPKLTHQGRLNPLQYSVLTSLKKELEFCQGPPGTYAYA